MKANIFKYIFFILVIILLGVGLYRLYNDKNKQTTQKQATRVKFDIIKEINVGVVNYDTTNPILSNNRDIQYIDKLIFQSLLDITLDFKIENLLTKEFSKIDDTTYSKIKR